MRGPIMPAQCDTVAAIVNVARWLMYAEGLAQEAALYLAENILGIAGDSDPHGIRSAARAALQEATK